MLLWNVFDCSHFNLLDHCSWTSFIVMFFNLCFTFVEYLDIINIFFQYINVSKLNTFLDSFLVHLSLHPPLLVIVDLYNLTGIPLTCETAILKIQWIVTEIYMYHFEDYEYKLVMIRFLLWSSFQHFSFLSRKSDSFLELHFSFLVWPSKCWVPLDSFNKV